MSNVVIKEEKRVATVRMSPGLHAAIQSAVRGNLSMNQLFIEAITTRLGVDTDGNPNEQGSVREAGGGELGVASETATVSGEKPYRADSEALIGDSLRDSSSGV